MIRYLATLFLALICSVPLSAKDKARVEQNFNDSWKFNLGDEAGAYAPAYNDVNWRSLNLPHDWSIEGAFSEANPATAGGGALPGGIGWYRKAFTLGREDAQKRIYIQFDGVYWNSTVFVNGQKVGWRPNGYIGFEYDITPYLKFGGEKNVVAVRVDNSEQPNSRWYSGSGIYRNVYLKKLSPVHVDYSGTYITTPTITAEQAGVDIETKVRNCSDSQCKATVVTSVYDGRGRKVAETTSAIGIPGDSMSVANQQVAVKQPKLWTLENPALYTAKTLVRIGNRLVDEYETTFGIRSFSFDAEKGFILNGVPTKIWGVCNHHDLGALGTAVNYRATERQLEILKAMGCNGIRTSHNPPSPQLLELCDRMGFVVMDEMFDMWRKKKSPYDYSQYFAQWHEKDLTDFILRDRNHPSVFIWSIGNEILEQWNDINVDTLDLQSANLMFNFANTLQKGESDAKEMHVNTLLTLKLANMVKSMDPTRPVSSGNNETEPSNLLLKSGAMDIIGFNYHPYNWGDAFKEKFSGKPLIITESTSGLMTRGYYMMPSDSTYIWPKRWDIPFDRPQHVCSAYDNCHVPWGTTHEESLKAVKANPHVSGFYIWTGFDYLGEPTPYWWPSRSSYFGIVDLAGFPKDIYYMYKSEWTKDTVLHIFPHWNWRKGEDVDVWAYYNNADEVELYINGVSQGIRKKGGDDLHVVWKTVFAPGELKAVSRKEGQVVAQQVINTAGAPAKISLVVDRSTINADGSDLAFVSVSIQDANGNECPEAANLVKFKLDGDAEIVGVDNGLQTYLKSLKDSEVEAFNGKCLAIVQNKGKKCEVRLTAESEGLVPASIQIRIK